MRVRHLWYHRAKERERRGQRPLLAAAECRAAATIAKLSRKPQPSLSWLSRTIAFLTTPFKFVGVSGWEDTGCEAECRGTPVRDAQHSTDGFWTLDVALAEFRIISEAAGEGRFVRVEVEPGRPAHDVCEKRLLTPRDTIAFGGPVVVDTDGPFLEVHPDGDFEVVR